MNRGVLSSFLVACSLAVPGLAWADAECPVADVGQACASGTCIPATCCDDPNGCAVSFDDAGQGGGSSGAGSSSSSGAGGGTGVSRDCAICTLNPGTFCPVLGQSCGNGETCQGGGGGGENLPLPDGGTTYVAFGFQSCESGGSGDDGGAGSSSGSFSDASVGESDAGAGSSGSSSGGSGGGSGGGHGSSSSGGSSGGSGSSGAGASSSSGASGSSGSGSGAVGVGRDDAGNADSSSDLSRGGCSVGPAAGGGVEGAVLALVVGLGLKRRRSARYSCSSGEPAKR
jgi:MYXO-CTERM domain-containing protein